MEKMSLASTRAGWTLRVVATVFAAGLLGVAVLAPSALAVHDLGVFQLEGDAQIGVPASTPGEDWDLICKAKPATCTFAGGYSAPGGTSDATAASHVSDGTLNATIFTGGGSKDPQDITSWAWKDQAGGLPDKDNLLHAYAARYSKAASTCPGISTPTCELIYFGSDRYDNSGDAQQAFWFLQSKVTLSNVPSGGGFKFSGAHMNGDLLIVSDFSNGGATSTINVYKWQSGALQLLAGGDSQKCGGSSSDPFCGIVNPSDGTTSPWTFKDKTGNSTFLNGEFYESGINLSDPSINLADECFSSFVAETRSSTSTTATLKDFVLGQFAPCSASLTTVPSAGAGGIVAPGVSVTDTAVVQGQGVSSPTTPQGNVTFYLCGPIATGTCTSGGTSLGTGALANSAPPAGEATATSPAVNTTLNPLGAGRYCFRATWPGDSTYPDPGPHSGTGDGECFYVQDPTSIATAQRWLPNDRATITSAGGSALSGTLAFSMYDTLAHCQSAGSTGRLYGPESFTLTSAASPAQRTTTNTTVLTSSQSVWWLVSFTSTDANVIGSTSNCTETSSLTITN